MAAGSCPLVAADVTEPAAAAGPVAVVEPAAGPVAVVGPGVAAGSSAVVVGWGS